MNIFSGDDSYYSLLNEVRLNLINDQNKKDNALIKKIWEVDFEFTKLFCRFNIRFDDKERKRNW